MEKGVLFFEGDWEIEVSKKKVVKYIEEMGIAPVHVRMLLRVITRKLKIGDEGKKWMEDKGVFGEWVVLGE